MSFRSQMDFGALYPSGSILIRNRLIRMEPDGRVKYVKAIMASANVNWSDDTVKDVIKNILEFK